MCRPIARLVIDKTKGLGRHAISTSGVGSGEDNSNRYTSSRRTLQARSNNDLEHGGFIQLDTMPSAVNKSSAARETLRRPRMSRSSSLASVDTKVGETKHHDAISSNVIHVKSEIWVRGEPGSSL